MYRLPNWRGAHRPARGLRSCSGGPRECESGSQGVKKRGGGKDADEDSQGAGTRGRRYLKGDGMPRASAAVSDRNSKLPKKATEKDKCRVRNRQGGGLPLLYLFFTQHVFRDLT